LGHEIQGREILWHRYINRIRNLFRQKEGSESKRKKKKETLRTSVNLSLPLSLVLSLAVSPASLLPPRTLLDPDISEEARAKERMFETKEEKCMRNLM
jgi:hypothetical protein